MTEEEVSGVPIDEKVMGEDEQARDTGGERREREGWPRGDCGGRVEKGEAGRGGSGDSVDSGGSVGGGWEEGGRGWDDTAEGRVWG